MANHTWRRVVLEDNHGNKYNGQLCTNCNALVVAFPPLDKEAEYYEEYRMILVRTKDLTDKDAQKWCKKFDVDCDEGNVAASEGLVKRTAEERAKRVFAKFDKVD